MKLLTNLIFEPKGKHDPALAYTIKDTVMSADGSKVYFALRDVPSGIALTDEDYWMLQIDLSTTKVDMELATAAANAAAETANTAAANVREDVDRLTEENAELKGDLDEENGKKLKPISTFKDIDVGSFFDTNVKTIQGHRYVFVCTPIHVTSFSVGNLVSGTFPDLVDGVTYIATITATQNGSLRCLPQGETIHIEELYVFDTTDNDVAHEFVTNALYMAPYLLYDIKNNFRNVIKVNSTDDQYDIFFKFLISAKVGKCDLVFDGGTYNLSNVYTYMQTYFNYNFRNELPIGNDCRYFFNGSTIIGTIPSNANDTMKNSISLMGCKWNKGSYEMHDGTLIANGMVYAVHDEMTGNDEYTHKYSNMIMKYNSGDNTNSIRKCIGGGAGRYGNIVLEKCVLISDYSHELSFHGYGNSIGNVNGLLTLNITNSYFEHGIQCDTLEDNEKGTLIYNGNSHSLDYAQFTNPNWDNYVWNNVTH